MARCSVVALACYGAPGMAAEAETASTGSATAPAKSDVVKEEGGPWILAGAPAVTFRAALPLVGGIIEGAGDSAELGSYPARETLIRLWGGSASARFYGAEAEVAFEDWFAGTCTHGPAITARLGVSLRAFAPDASGTGWEVRIPALAGFSHHGLAGGGCEYSSDEEYQFLTAAFGVDATIWGRSRLGFHWRILSLLGGGWKNVDEDYWGDRVHESLAVRGITLDIGVAWGI